MFGYFGSKRRLAPTYPKPMYDTIVEPFAGAAGYAMHADHWTRNVILYDTNPNVIDVWQWIQAASPEDIMALPNIEPGSYPVPHDTPPYYLMLWASGGDGSHVNTPGRFQIKCWPATRRYMAANLDKIRHWQIVHGDYRDAPDIEASWFIDPPYQHQGHRYTNGSDGIDYAELADWCRTRRGQVIVCEQEPADWLPFRYHTTNKTQSNKYVAELMWSNQPSGRLFDIQ